MKDWRCQVRQVLFDSAVSGDAKRLDELLLDGWEPFAATARGRNETVYHLRRERYVDVEPS